MLADYSASIDWGDLSTSAASITLSGGVFTVRGSHTYAEEGTKPITVTLSHESAANATANSTATMSVPAVVLTGGFSLSAVEGVASASPTVPTFAVPGGAEVLADYSASIDWGDLSTSAGSITLSGGVFTVKGSHTYAEEGTKTITVTLSHDAAGSSSASSTATIADPAVVVTGVAVSASEGSSFSGSVATFTDPGSAEAVGDYTATINWGDSSSDGGTISTNGDGSFTVNGSHKYTEEGSSYPITIFVSHDTAPTASAATTGTVSDPAVSPTGGFTVTAVEGAGSGARPVATFTDPGGAEILTDYSASIEWGDSSTSSGTITLSAGVFTVRGSHTYADEGTKPITVTPSHDGAPTATATSTATISDPAVSPTDDLSALASDGE